MLFISFDNNFGLKRASSKINIYFLVLLYASYRLVHAIIRFIKKPLSCKSSKPDSTAGDRVKRAGLTTPPPPTGSGTDVLYSGLQNVATWVVKMAHWSAVKLPHSIIVRPTSTNYL